MEKSRQSQGRIRRNTSFAKNNLIDSPRRHMQGQCKLVLRKMHWFNEFSIQYFAGMYR